MLSNSNSTSSERVERALLDGREIVPGLSAASLEKFGSFVDAREAPPDAKTIVLIKHIHGTQAENAIMGDPQAFREYVAHQDAVFAALTTMQNAMGSSRGFRVSIEAITPETPLPMWFLESIDAVERRRGGGTFTKLETMRQAMAAGSDDGESARHHLHAGLRFVAREVMAKRGKEIVAGRAQHGLNIFESLKIEANQLVYECLEKGSIDDASVQRVVDRAKERYRADHETRHAFVRQSLEKAVSEKQLGAVLYGSAHFSGVSPSPIEDAFEGWRVLVFEPAFLQECEKHKTPDEVNLLDATAVTVESVRAAIIKALRPTGAPWDKA